MNNMTVRMKSVTINGFKNVVKGTLGFENTYKPYKASIVGLYGQNGSGKTALIDAIYLLKQALTGSSVPQKYVDYINVNATHAKLDYEFIVKNKLTDGIYRVVYSFCIKKDIEDTENNAEVPEPAERSYKVTLFDEVLSYSYDCNEIKNNFTKVIDTRTVEVFNPKSKYRILVGNDNETQTDLLVEKKIALNTSRSFVFSKKLINVIRGNCKVEEHKNLINALVNYGNFELFVINTSNSGLISMNALPISFKYEEDNIGTVGNLTIRLNQPTLIPEDMVLIVQKIVDNMNVVLTQLVPGLTIAIKKLGTQVLQDGKKGCEIQLMSHKNGKEISLQYESEGIKKIISVLQLLIVVYNKESITVAIDELDSGVFEYLLGELLRIISEKGRGQLIFTSHNLRPLETLDKGFVAFTTVNPENRYIRMLKIKKNNNLRDFYYRDIILGEQNEPVYEATNNYDIALAFREAGEYHGE